MIDGMPDEDEVMVDDGMDATGTVEMGNEAGRRSLRGFWWGFWWETGFSGGISAWGLLGVVCRVPGCVGWGGSLQEHLAWKKNPFYVKKSC